MSEPTPDPIPNPIAPELLRPILAVVVGIALIGFLRGVSTTDAAAEGADLAGVEGPAMASAGRDGLREAPTYRALRDRPPGQGSGWEADMLALQQAGPGVTDPVVISGDPAAKAVDLAARAARRAYDGAPPRVPHPIRQDSAAECLACHDEGLRFRGLLAPPMSHTTYTSCAQCHVVEDAPMPGGADLPADPRAVANAFIGTPSPTAGPRAWSVAPPQIPHRTWMREQCDSCHGVNGRDAIRSSHPWRESCQQCHTAPAANDLRPTGEDAR